MKFKKAFAWILAVAMVITLMPSMAFASTTNSVSATPTVAADTILPSTAGVISMQVKDAQGIGSGTITATLTNATWVDDFVDTQSPTYINVKSNPSDWEANVAVNYVTKNKLEFRFSNFNNNNEVVNINDYIIINFPNAIKSGSDAGEVKLAIDGGDSAISPTEHTIAIVGTSSTISTVINDPVATDRASNIRTADIEIKETTVNSIQKDQEFKMTLPKGFKWVTGGAGTSFKGSLGVQYDSWLEDDGRTLVCQWDCNSNPNERQSIIVQPVINVTGEAALGEVTVTIRGIKAYNDVTANPLEVDTEARVIGDAAGLVIANYTEAAVKISTSKELPTFVSGKFADKNDKYYIAEITLEETIKDALVSGRYVDISFPDNVQVLPTANPEFKVKYNSTNKTRITNDAAHFTVSNTLEKNVSSFEFTVPENDDTIAVIGEIWKDDDVNKVTFFIPLTVEAGYEGDITATVSGPKAGIESTDIVVAKAVPPVTVTSSAADLKNGIQKQSIGDITITENGAGYIGDYDWVDADLNHADTPGIGYTGGKDAAVAGVDSQDFNGKVITIDINTLGLEGMVFESFDSVEVTAGDLEIGKASIKNSNGTIEIPIKFRSAKEASTITIKGATVALNRTLPEGGYDLRVKGGAVVENTLCSDEDFSPNAVVAKDYVKIVTPADPGTTENKIDATFVLRQDTFVSNGETIQMDTAPYLDANNRTQLPIRYAAIACGVDENDISWNQATQTATINAGNTVLRITIGSNIMQTSAGNIAMDTAAVSSNGRIFVPIRYIANALGANVGWDYDTKTITLTN